MKHADAARSHESNLGSRGRTSVPSAVRAQLSAPEGARLT